MKRSTLNFIIDLISFVDMLVLVLTGIIMKYILPPGSGGRGWALHGGRGGDHIKTFWSMTRHEWGDIHSYFAAALVVLMAGHIILHWTWIKNYVRSLLTRTHKPGGRE